ncbi:hypothetical protein B0H14DRAFT_3084269 [Mycena olivaceomarginata]|nr:hypothetical protein B0H14DRAFT_3084269 [Mycena olivaceomarginata]
MPSEERFVQHPHITKFGGQAGAPLPQHQVPTFGQYEAHLSAVDTNEWSPFKSRMDWAIARWAKLRGSTSTAFSDLLAIDGLPEALGLSYRTSGELNEILDKNLPTGRPAFQREEVVVAGEAFDVYFRDIIECVRGLYSDPEFANTLSDTDKTVRLYHDLHTGKWWWATQKILEQRRPGATIIPIIISTDKRQTTMFRNKSAYPVYMSIGNIPKGIRRKPSRQGYILIGYLPTTRLEHIKVAAARRRAIANLYHAQRAWNGIYMASGDGVVRRTHPILAVFSGDYPEQCLAAGCKAGECPTCPVESDELGDLEALYEPRDLDAVLAAFAKAEGDATEFTRACKDAGIKPIHHPFWEDLPFVNIFLSITPDILHQLFQGVIKHVVSWVKDAYGPLEIDARCRRLPPNHNIRLFLKGITTLSRVSGTEHGQICRILLGLISPVRLVRAVRAALDFLYHSQYPIHSSETIDQLAQHLRDFHNNKAVFVDLGIRQNFNIPKLHNVGHYPLFICLFGTFDNFNTEHTERLHIDFTKDAYCATNRKDSGWKNTTWRPPSFLQHRHLQMTKLPSVYGVKLDALATHYGAEFFTDAFARFVVAFKNPTFSARQVEHAAADFMMPFQSVSVYHKIKFWNEDPFGQEDRSDTLDVIHVKPGYTNKRGRLIGGRFDTAIANDGAGEHVGIKGYRVVQVRVVFSLTATSLENLFPGPQKPPQHLTYVELFTKFPRSTDRNHGMYKISRPAERVARIIPVANLRRSVHLFPQFGPVVPREWTSQNVMDHCSHFTVSPNLFP